MTFLSIVIATMLGNLVFTLLAMFLKWCNRMMTLQRAVNKMNPKPQGAHASAERETYT